MFFGITKMMMIFFGWFSAIYTFKFRHWLKITFFNSLANNVLSVIFLLIKIIANFALSAKLFAMRIFIFLRNLLYYLFAMFALVVSFYSFNSFRCSNIPPAIFLITSLTISLVFISFAFVKFRDWFNLFTHTAFFSFHSYKYNSLLGTCQEKKQYYEKSVH